METATLYVGADNETGKIDLDRIAKIVGARHEGFTLVSATGYWKGSQEPSALVIISDDSASVVVTAELLCAELNQDAVALQWSAPFAFVTKSTSNAA